MPESKYLCGIFSIQERLEHGNCGFGFLLVVLSPRTAAKEEEEREGGGRMSFHKFYILKAVVNH